MEAIDKWLEIELASSPGFILDRIGMEEARRRLRASVVHELNYCTDDDLALGNYNYCRIAGTSPENYKYRQLETPLGLAVTSIRYIGGDLTKPAVFLIFKDFELNSPEDIREIAQFIKGEYSAFRPERIRWSSPAVEADLIRSSDSINGDMIYVAGFLDELKRLPRPVNFDRVELQRASNTEWYEKYAAGYSEMIRRWPAFSEMARAESLETVEELIRDGLLFEIYAGNEWAGIIAASRRTDGIFEGYCVMEQFLLRNLRGRQLAPAVQRHLVEKLQHQQHDMLYGTIHYNNLPSLKTALRTGRKAAGSFIFCDII